MQNEAEAITFLSETKMSNLLGQAYGLRPIYHFHLLLTYGTDSHVFKSVSHNFGVSDEALKFYMILWPIDKAIWTNDPLVNQSPGYPTAKPSN